MATPPQFQPLPTTTDPKTGAVIATGAELLPWSLDTLDVAGKTRLQLMRLQAWVSAIAGKANTAAPADPAPAVPKKKGMFGL